MPSAAASLHARHRWIRSCKEFRRGANTCTPHANAPVFRQSGRPAWACMAHQTLISGQKAATWCDISNNRSFRCSCTTSNFSRGSSGSAELDPDWMLSPGAHLEDFIGPICLHGSQGSGLSYVASRDVDPGALLLVNRPLAVIHAAEAHHMPQIQDLVELLTQQRYNASQAAWLQLLQGSNDTATAGTSSSSSSSSTSTSSSSRDAAEAGARKSSSSTSSSSSRLSVRLQQASFLINQIQGQPAGQGSSQSKAESKVACPCSREELVHKCNFNSYAGPAQDAAAAACGQLLSSFPGGHLGLWPAFALLNHSCSPNACFMVLGEAMVVRAARGISGGEPVNISYIGAAVLQPVERRRALLQEDYGFSCNCPRCQFEASLPSSLSVAVTQAVAMSQTSTQAVLGRKRQDRCLAHDGLMQLLQLADDCRQQLQGHGHETGAAAGGQPQSSPGTGTSFHSSGFADTGIEPLQAQPNTMHATDWVVGAGPGANSQPQALWLDSSLFSLFEAAINCMDSMHAAAAAAAEMHGSGCAAVAGQGVHGGGLAGLCWEDHLRVLGRALEAVASVAPGSELHLDLCLKALVVAAKAGVSPAAAIQSQPPVGLIRSQPVEGQSFGMGGGGSMMARMQPQGILAALNWKCHGAFVARYGAVSPRLYLDLVRAQLSSLRPHVASADMDMVLTHVQRWSRQAGAAADLAL